MADGPSLPPGWYTGDDGIRRHWDGTRWSDSDVALRRGAVVNVEAAEASGTTVGPRSLLSRKLRTGIAVGGLVVLVGAIAIPLGVYLAAADWRTAEDACRTEVIDNLKSPSTATLSEVQVLDSVEYQRHLYETINGLIGDLGIEDAGFEDAEIAESLAEAKEKQDEQASHGKRELYVIGAVDSENGFSAMVRNTWTCEMSFENGEVMKGPSVDFSGD